MLLKACELAQTTVIDIHFHEFSPMGITGTITIAESISHRRWSGNILNERRMVGERKCKDWRNIHGINMERVNESAIIANP